MKQIKFEQSGLELGPIAYGCWRLSRSDPNAADRQIRTALDHGINIVDTADVYGVNPREFGGAENVLGDILKAGPELRGQIFLATKGGIVHGKPYDSTYAYLNTAIDQSLTRLKTNYVDLYQIHRPDISVPMSETARALNGMVKAGKTKHIGVSNFTVAQTRALQAHLETPIITTQPEFSVLQQDPIIDGTLDWCQETSASALAWSPLAGGRIFSETGDVIDTLDRLAKTYESTRGNIALAFTMGHGANVIPIIGTQKINRIIESSKAADISLVARDYYDIIEAYRGVRMP